MNWLAHLRLAPRAPLLRLGNLCGDFVRGVDLATLHPELRVGIEQHRALDRRVDAHPVVRRSRSRVAPERARYSGVLVDVFYDHFLAREWAVYGDGTPLGAFVNEVHEALEAHRRHLPPRLVAVLPWLREERWLAAYASLPGIDTILLRMAQRAPRRAPLAAGGEDLRAGYPAFEADFRELWPELLAAAPV